MMLFAGEASSTAPAMIAIDAIGQGAPLVLLHGVGANRSIWRRVSPGLATSRLVLAPDLPGFGKSPAIPGPFALGAVAQALADALADRLGGSFDLVGNSLGGAVALILAQHRPELVARLVLAAPAGFSPRSRSCAPTYDHRSRRSRRRSGSSGVSATASYRSAPCPRSANCGRTRPSKRSPRWRTVELDHVVQRLGFRYLMVNRPGFAGSDPSPGRSVADFGRDLEDVIDSLGYDRVAVVGVSPGAPHALACGWTLAERVSSLAAVSPLGPSGGEGGSGGLRYRIALVPFMLAGIGPGLAELCLHTARLHGGTEARVMIEDLLVCRRPWGFDAADIRAPVHIWHGRADRLVPLAHALKLAATIPACTALVDPTGGHFFYSRRLADILEPLGGRATCGAPHFQDHLSGVESGAPDP